MRGFRHRRRSRFGRDTYINASVNVIPTRLCQSCAWRTERERERVHAHAPWYRRFICLRKAAYQCTEVEIWCDCGKYKCTYNRFNRKKNKDARHK